MLRQTILMMAMLLPAGLVHGAELPETPGVALTAGLGYQSGHYGGALTYYLPQENQLSLNPYVGVGYSNSRKALGLEATVSLSGGCMLSWGYRHRALADLSFSPMVRIIENGRKIYGSILAFGYEFLGESGFIFRFITGYGVAFTKTDPTFIPMHNISLGYKFY